MTTSPETKALRLAAVEGRQAEGRLDGVSDIDIAAAFGCRRETIWRDKQATRRADELCRRFLANPPAARGYTTGQAARALNTTPDNIHAYRRAGKLAASQDATGRWRIAASEIERLRRDGVERKRPGPKPR